MAQLWEAAAGGAAELAAQVTSRLVTEAAAVLASLVERQAGHHRPLAEAAEQQG